MNPINVYMISGLIGLVFAIGGFLLGSLLTRNGLVDRADERYEQGFNAGDRVGWYKAADELGRVADQMTSEGYSHRAGMIKSAARYLNDFYDHVDGERP